MKNRERNSTLTRGGPAPAAHGAEMLDQILSSRERSRRQRCIKSVAGEIVKRKTWAEALGKLVCSLKRNKDARECG